VLAVPTLYIVPEDTLLSSAAETLETSSEALLSANRSLPAVRDRGRRVLVVPLETEGQP